MKGALQAAWTGWAGWWATQPTRVRWLLMLALPAAVLGLFDALAWSGMQRDAAALRSRLEAARRESAALEQVAASTRAARAQADARGAQARDEIAELDKALREAVARSVPPAQMSERLAELMQRMGGATPVGLESTAPQALAGGELYRHPFVLRVEGDFASLLGAVRSIEKDLPPLQWRGVEFHAVDPPMVRGRFDVFTLSGQSVWIRL